MPKPSAALLLYRTRPDSDAAVEVLLVHPGGPYWASKDLGAWSIPKGEYDDGEALLDAARREFAEEVGLAVPAGDIAELGEHRLSSGKVVTAFALRGDVDLADFSSNDFDMEWPPKSGRVQSFPECDRAEWFDLNEARRRVSRGQVPFIDDLEVLLAR